MMTGKPLLLACFLCIATAADFASGFFVARPRSVAAASSSVATARSSSASSLRAAKGGGGGGGKIKKKSVVRLARSDRGFGSPPPKLADVLASFKSRVPGDADSRPCPCGSGDVYADCCGPLHRGERSFLARLFSPIRRNAVSRQCRFTHSLTHILLFPCISCYRVQAIVFVRP